MINTGNAKEDEILFATKRYDRLVNDNSKKIDGLICPFRLHQEDFAQVLGISSYDKYETGEQKYLPKLFRVLRNHSKDPIEDQLKLWDMIVYDFLVGNTDNHIKNLSLVYSKSLREKRLAPAYDIVSTAIYPSSSREMAIGIGGERTLDKIIRKHFVDAASEAGINEKIALRYFDVIAGGFEQALNTAADELSEQGYANAKKIKEKILKDGGYNHI